MATNGGKKKRELSPEARQKLSELAKQRHKEGKFGGREFGKLGGRPRKDRASRRVAEAAQEDQNARALIEVFKDAIDHSQPIGTRLKGARAWLEVEQAEAKVALQEEANDATERSREELIALLSQKLTQGPTSQIIRNHLASQVIDGTAEEINGDSADAEHP